MKTIITLLLFTVVFQYSNAQNTYIVKIKNPKKRILLNDKKLKAQVIYELPGTDGLIKKQEVKVTGIISGIKGEYLYVTNERQQKDVYYSNGQKRRSESYYYGAANINEPITDSIRIDAITSISRKGSANVFGVVSGVLTGAFAGYVITGPLYAPSASAYFRTVGVMFVTAVPVIVGTHLISESINKKPVYKNKKGKWKIEQGS